VLPKRPWQLGVGPSTDTGQAARGEPFGGLVAEQSNAIRLERQVNGYPGRCSSKVPHSGASTVAMRRSYRIAEGWSTNPGGIMPSLDPK
jgi:hypothetical protein